MVTDGRRKRDEWSSKEVNRLEEVMNEARAVWGIGK